MQSRNILQVLLVLTALCEVTGCSQSNQNSDPMASQNSDTSVTTTKIINGQAVRQTETRHITVEPLPPNGQLPVDATRNDETDTDNFSNGNSRQVRISAPLVNLNVDRDSGSVHVNTPFVRIDKNGRGQGAEIEIPHMHIESN
jgi:hypothetical protein